MRLRAPSYYPSFACIAERCSHSCCIGWGIVVDEVALARYRALPATSREAILATVATDRETSECTFRMGADGRCPHLTAAGLCRIIEQHGDGLLCDICREHPRFYHTTAHGAEVGLGASCEEACRLILSSDGYDTFVDVGEAMCDERPTFDAVAVRRRLYATLSDRTRPYTERLSALWQTVAAYTPPRTDDARALLASLEYLKEDHRPLLLSYTDTPCVSEEDEVRLERFLAYLILRHASDAEDEAELSCALRLCFFCERLLASLLACGMDAYRAARLLSEELEYSEDNIEVLRMELPFL